jgi:NAD(P)-dependent dehydrogenase (short-subunit alcohol dehydrogenase family)
MPERVASSRTRNLLLSAGALLATAAVARAVARNRRFFDLRGKVALVTGGSRGLGLVLARELVAAGCRVAVVARDPEELERARADLERGGARVLAVPCDVTVREQVEAAVAEVRERLGPVDVLINNAGVIQVGPMDEMTAEDYDHALRIHFWAPLFTTWAVLPDMRRQHGGRIVNIASIGGKISFPHLLPYSASKFALVGFSEGLRGALSRDGIYVTTVCPGLMRTGSPRNVRLKGRHRSEYAWFSISDSLPLISMDAVQAARRIIDACRHGDGELLMPFSTALAVRLYGLVPGVGADVMGWLERAMPGPGGVGTASRRGAESESQWSPSWLTSLTDAAAQRNNEVATGEAARGAHARARSRILADAP